MQKDCAGSAPFLTVFQVTKPNVSRGAAEFSQSERLVFLVALVMGAERTKSLRAIWNRAFSQFYRM